MSRIHRPFALLLGASLAFAAVATPGIAHAGDATTATTAAAVVDALKAAHTPTVAAAEDGWSSHWDFTETGTPTYSMDVTYAAAEGRDLLAETGTAATTIEVDHQGTYESLSAFTESDGVSIRRVKRALTLIGHPDKTWVYQPDPTIDLGDPDSGIAGAGPDTVLQSLVDPDQTKIVGTPTQAVAADGSVTYGFAVKSTYTGEDEGEPTTESGYDTVTIDAGNVLTGLTEDFSDYQVTETYAVGKEHIALPAADEVVRGSLVREGVNVLTMPADARRIVEQVQSEVYFTHHRRAGTVRLIRSSAASEVAMTNYGDHPKIFATRNIAGGVRVTATNPLTHQKLAYTVTAHGKQAAIHRVTA
jgi:hypothetical protein